MSQFQKDLEAAISVITQLLSAKIASQFNMIIIENEYNEGQTITQHQHLSKIIHKLQLKDEIHIELFRKIIIQTFKHHNHDVNSIRFVFLYSSSLFCLCARIYFTSQNIHNLGFKMHQLMGMVTKKTRMRM